MTGVDGLPAYPGVLLWEREHRGWSRPQLRLEVRAAARRLKEVEPQVDVVTIRRWETGATRPSAYYARLLCEVYGTTADKLGLVHDFPASAFRTPNRELEDLLASDTVPDQPGDNLMGQEDDTERRAFLALLVAAGSGLIDVERLAAPTVDALYLRDAEALTTALLDQWYAATPRVLLPPVLAHLNGLQRSLPGPPELENLTARTALVAGHLFDKLDRPSQSRMHYALAESLARDIRDDDLLAAILVLRSGLHSWRRTNDRRRGFELVIQAQATIAPGTSPPLLQTLVMARMAEERAAIGDVDGFERDMAAAEAALQGSEDHWYGPRDAAELAAVRGASELLLGRHADAADTLAWTLERMNPDAVNRRAVVAADRDRALAAL